MKYNEIKLEEKEEKLEILRQETPLWPVFPAIAAVAKTLACNKRTWLGATRGRSGRDRDSPKLGKRSWLVVSGEVVGGGGAYATDTY